MYAPGASQNKINPNPPKVTFRMVRGRIIPIVNGKQPKGATKPLRQELNTRIMEVKQAERGMRGATIDDRGNFKGFGTKSSFPKFFGDLGFNSKKQFLNVVAKKKGKKYEELVDDSIDSLLHGRSSTFGDIPPDERFRLATKQEFNNTGVAFRMIDGKVRPMRFTHSEVPF
jgi:hypothetical protein